MTVPIAWLAEYALRKGLRYRPDVDERWLRVWEPFATLRTPIRYEHALEATGESGSLTIARFSVQLALPTTAPGAEASEASAWIAIAQDVRIAARAAATCDVAGVFGEPLDIVTMPRRMTGDAAFDHVFASFAPTPADLARAVTPSLRKLTLSWRVPLHFELRPGGFIVAPVALGEDPASLSWLLHAIHFFGDKASKPIPPTA